MPYCCCLKKILNNERNPNKLKKYRETNIEQMSHVGDKMVLEIIDISRSRF